MNLKTIMCKKTKNKRSVTFCINYISRDVGITISSFTQNKIYIMETHEYIITKKNQEIINKILVGKDISNAST